MIELNFLFNPYSRSILFHLVVLALICFFALIAPPLNQVLPPEEISFEVVEPKDPNQENQTARSKTVVRSTEGQRVERAKPDSYLSDANREVREETVAKNPGEAASSAVNITQAPPRVAPKSSSTIKLSDLGLKLSPLDAPKKDYEKERQWADPQTGQAAGGGEYVRGIKEGEVSALNTREFIYYSYYERVRKQLDQAWQPLLREQIARIYKNGRRLASNSDYVTRTLVTLNSNGEVERVQMLEESGTIDLDTAAIDALNRAGPYPNPPKGLVDPQGKIQIRWDFILKT